MNLYDDQKQDWAAYKRAKEVFRTARYKSTKFLMLKAIAELLFGKEVTSCCKK